MVHSPKSSTTGFQTTSLDYSLFADESGTGGERCVCLGAIVLPTDSVPYVESVLEEFSRRGFATRELSWKNCSKGEVDRYRDFAELFWHLQQAIPPVDFRALVIDTVQNPLRHDGYSCSTHEQGFYKFYHYFLTKTVQKAAWRGSRFTFNLASTSDSYPHRTEVLSKTVNGALNRAVGKKFEHVNVRRPEPKESRIHQLADVLLGAVSYAANGRHNFKGEIVDVIEGYVGKRLSHDFMPMERPFNVWWWVSKGQKRWAPGSRGFVE